MPGDTEGMFYSFDLGPVHFVSISTEFYYYYHYFGKESLYNQYAWLEKELAEADKNRFGNCVHSSFYTHITILDIPIV